MTNHNADQPHDNPNVPGGFSSYLNSKPDESVSLVASDAAALAVDRADRELRDAEAAVSYAERIVEAKRVTLLAAVTTQLLPGATSIEVATDDDDPDDVWVRVESVSDADGEELYAFGDDGDFSGNSTNILDGMDLGGSATRTYLIGQRIPAPAEAHLAAIADSRVNYMFAARDYHESLARGLAQAVTDKFPDAVEMILDQRTPVPTVAWVRGAKGVLYLAGTAFNPFLEQMQDRAQVGLYMLETIPGDTEPTRFNIESWTR